MLDICKIQGVNLQTLIKHYTFIRTFPHFPLKTSPDTLSQESTLHSAGNLHKSKPAPKPLPLPTTYTTDHTHRIPRPHPRLEIYLKTPPLPLPPPTTPLSANLESSLLEHETIFFSWSSQRLMILSETLGKVTTPWSSAPWFGGEARRVFRGDLKTTLILTSCESP